MNRVAIAYSTKDRVDLTRQTIRPLLQPDKFDLHWVDGSQTTEGRELPREYDGEIYMAHHDVIGGSCRAIVYALTKLVRGCCNKDVPDKAGRKWFHDYTHVGLVENDVLLDPDWFEPTMELFEKGDAAGLNVGAVSARNFEDRILIQRDGYSINHNLGAGCIIFKREAAELILQQYRTGWTGENRKMFSMLSGIDIGSYWAFRGNEHPLVADWTWDWMLAQHGYVSLALTPCKATHLEDLSAMGLRLVTEARETTHADDVAFMQLKSMQYRLPTTPNALLFYDGTWTIFPHQIPIIGGGYCGNWRFHWSPGFGCFAWKAGEAEASMSVGLLGPVEVLVSGGVDGGKVRIEDGSGFKVEPDMPPESKSGTLACVVPGGFVYRNLTLTALSPGVIFYGIRAREAQPSGKPFSPLTRFDFDSLPPL